VREALSHRTVSGGGAENDYDAVEQIFLYIPVGVTISDNVVQWRALLHAVWALRQQALARLVFVTRCNEALH
jgi:hypothetical protein